MTARMIPIEMGTGDTGDPEAGSTMGRPDGSFQVRQRRGCSLASVADATIASRLHVDLGAGCIVQVREQPVRAVSPASLRLTRPLMP